ncbi:MAG: 50S ribosomal protein L5 [Phycisphaeraceae bacterium]
MSDEKKKQKHSEQGEKKPKQPQGEGKGGKPRDPSKGKADAKSKGQPKAEKPAGPVEPAPPARMRLRFQKEVAPKIGQEFGITNRMALPRLEKVLLTVGLGKQLEGLKLNAKAKEQVLKDLAVIAGQKAVMCKAKKSVANFKLREGFEIGAMVTLRGARMWEFVDRLISLAIPRIKDFRGLSAKSFDQGGNYSFGITEQGIFPEVNMADVEFQHGMNVTFVFRNSNQAKSRAVLRELGLPFAQPQDAPTQRKAG